MQARSAAIGAITLALVIVSFAVGLGFAGGHTTTLVQYSTNIVTFSTTQTITYASSATGPNTSTTFTITKEIIVQDTYVNDICVITPGGLNVVSSSFLVPPGLGNGPSPVTVTTTTITQPEAVTLYENATIYSNTSFVCTLINPHYNVTQTSTNPDCFCA